ncbi:hypothetical protein G9F72_002195 [Clostridium estertheticum]|uniref:hypothetical protein n=1 Tax=Clostridium estertheticum TaxID=238834 RepID=UPI0013E95D72|nr:hypothetical protein [Clostridium estertheticum]MBZ9685165.1 hypothetical protein [Clostridium estertheticum]
MSSLRQIKTLVTLDITLITFVVWVAMTNFLFKNVADYKLFFLSLVVVFLMQCIYLKKNNKYLAIILPTIGSIPFMWILFDGLAILINLIFVVAAVFVNLAMEELPVDYQEYKSKAKQGAIILALIAIISFWLEKSIADYLYRFFINYMIVTVILLKESRNYYYKVGIESKNTEKAKKISIIKNLFTNIFFKYGIVVISTIMLTTDCVFNKSLSSINVLNKGLDIVIGKFLDLVIKIVGPIIVIIIDILRKLLRKNFLPGLDGYSKSLFFSKNKNLENSGATAADNIIWFTTVKIIILLIFVLFIIDVIKKMRFMKSKSEQYTEEKEKMDKNSKEYKHKNSISTILKKVFRMNNTMKDKILNIYRDFEKITEKAKIYKSYMTATQLKNTTKANIENDDYLDEMTDIYNEVKFSNYEPSENQLDLVRKSLDNVKKQL